LIHFSGKNACVTYDEQVMNDDNLFQQFLESDANTMIFEDSDNHIRPRQDGNSMMHKFLNVSDGIISSSDKKLIFSTNLPSSNNIDEALLRPGRCFDIMNFRALNRVEAEKVCKDIGRVLPDGNEFFLTNLFNGAMPSEQVITKMGF
jgi:SpoVK/Ycf46/Vps4 family AAA+-type ATPase